MNQHDKRIYAAIAAAWEAFDQTLKAQGFDDIQTAETDSPVSSSIETFERTRKAHTEVVAAALRWPIWNQLCDRTGE